MKNDIDIKTLGGVDTDLNEPQIIHAAYVWFISAIIALGGFLFGYNWVVIGGAKPFYETYFHLSSASMQGWAMSCALLGCFLGALLSGMLSEPFGRRCALFVTALLFTLSAICTGFAGSFIAFVLWRTATGVAIGLASSLSPMYIAEIAPAKIRGKLVCMNSLAIKFGILSSQVVNWLIAKPISDSSTAAILVSWNGQHGWRWMFAAAAVPATALLLGMLWVPESPRWLVTHGRVKEAASTLERIGGKVHAQFVLQEIEAATMHSETRSEVRQLIQPRYRHILVLGIALVFLQQWCGINVIFNYAQEIFSAAGYTLSSILFNIVITGMVMVLFTSLAVALVDSFGRRPLILFGTGGLLVLYTMLGFFFNYHSRGLPMLLLVVMAIACFAISLGPVPWVILSEIYPGPVRGTAMAISTASLWLACFILTYTFPLLNEALGIANTFWIYSAICAAGILFLRRNLPETRHKTLEEIEKSWA